MKPARTAGVQRLAYVLDELIRIPGTNIRIGADALLGLLPVGGDVAGGLLSAYVLLAAGRMGAPAPILVRMAGNIAIDTLLGAIPLLGDIFDIGWRANRRNVQLLEQFTSDPRRVEQKSQVLVGALVLGVVLLVAGVAWLGYRIIRWLILQL